ncbi:MAG TPA: hypothetical protein VF952_01845 [Chloroflexia bacterium]|jgi:hypothetical protein
MAMVWITQIENFRKEIFTLRQSDPTYHPVIGGHQYKPDERIRVLPRYSKNASSFAVPWADHGRLLIDGPNSRVTVIVGPTSTSSIDYLRCFDRQKNEIKPALPMGPRGGSQIADVSLHLVFNDTGVHFIIWSANQVGNDIIQEAKKLGDLLAGALIAKLSQPSE